MLVIRMDSHSGHLVSSVAKLYQNSEATDCVLDAKGGFICAHKTILAACSPYMKKLVMNHGEMRIFSFKEVEHKIMKLILDIVYYGEVEVPSCSMALFIQTTKLLQITNLNITETFSKTNTGEQGSDNCTGSRDMNHSRNNKSILPILQNWVNTNPILCHESENGNNSGSGNYVERAIHSSETEVCNIFEEVSGRMNKDHPMTAISNSEEAVGDRESSEGVSLQDELNPISFVAVPSVSVKSEEVDDEQSLSCITNVEFENSPVDLPCNNDCTNELVVNRNQKFATESMVNAEDKDVSSDLERKKDPSSTISSVMNQSLNELSTSVVNVGLIDTQPNSPSLIGLQQNKNPESYTMWINKYTLKKSRVVLSRIETILTTGIGNAVNKESSSLIPLKASLNTEEAEDEQVFSSMGSQQNGNHKINKAHVSKLKLTDGRVVLNSMKPLSEKGKDGEHKGLERSRCSSVTHEEMESTHVSHHTEENVSNVIQKGTSDSKYAAKQKFIPCCSNEIFVCDFCRLSFSSKESLRSHILSHTGKTLFSCNICQKYFAVKSNLKIHMRNHSEKRPYSCDICKETFSLKCNLKNHARVHSGDTPFSCDVCEASFTKKMYLKVHMRSHTGEKSFSCNACMASFNKKLNLLRHQKIHTGEKPFSCHACLASFNMKSNLLRHQKIHTEKKPFSCSVCALSFSSETGLVRHNRIHTGEKPFKCDVCKACFSHKSRIIRHMRIHTGEKPFTCDVCKVSYSDKANLKIHMGIHTGVKPYSCDMCKASFRQLSGLKSHRRTHTGEKSFSCGVCKSAFTHKGNLRSLMRIHTGEKPYSCEVCKESFRNLYTLKGHRRTHSGEKPFSCSVCNSSFSRKASLHCHMRIHTGEKPFSCEMCKASFRHLSTLKDHRRTHTEEKPFSCDVCAASFSAKMNLVRHQTIHSGEKPFTCDMCEASFARKIYLKKHMRIHTGEKPYSCDICKVSFRHLSALKDHRKTHSGEKPFSCTN